MRKHNVDASTSRFVQVGGHPARMQAVLGGRADAALVNIVTSIDAIESGKVKVVAKVAQEFPKLGYVWNVVRDETIMDPAKAGIIQQLTTAGMNGSRFIMQSPDEAAAILNERIPSLALDLCKRVILDLNKDGVWGVDGGIDADVVDFTASTGKELGLLKRDVKTSEMTDTRFVDAAIKDPALSK
jgi:ABC-type nitrate/sulfonate/bicarbonate transport system substrate-binding protein